MQEGADRAVKRLGAVWRYLLSALLFVTVCVAWDHFSGIHGHEFQDSNVYARALQASRGGFDPYLTSPALPLLFVYPPIFLKLGVRASILLPGTSGYALYLALLAVATLAIPCILVAGYLPRSWLTPAFALLLFTFEPGLIASESFFTGNIAALLYALVLAVGIPGVRLNRWMPFYFAVVVAALIKPPMLAFLLLPALAGSRQWFPIALTGCATIAGYASQRVSSATMYAAYQRAALEQLIKRSDLGFGLLYTYSHLWQSFTFYRVRSFALTAFLTTALIVLGALLMARRRQARAATSDLWVPALLVSIIVLNPRMQDYDSTFALIPAIYIMVEILRSRRVSGPIIALVASLLAMILAVNFRTAINVVLVGAIALAVIQQFNFAETLQVSHQS